MAVQAIYNSTDGFNSGGASGGGGNSGGYGSTTITLPVTPNNYASVPRNSMGLTTLLPIDNSDISTSDGNPKALDYLLDTTNTKESIDISEQSINLVINVVSDVYVNTPDIREITYPKEVKGADFIGYDVDFDISWNSVHATIIRMYVGNSTDYVELGPKGNLTLNVKELLDKYPLQSSEEPFTPFVKDGMVLNLILKEVVVGGQPSEQRDFKGGRGGGGQPSEQRDRREEKREYGQRREQKDNGQMGQQRQAPPLPSIDIAQRNVNNNYGDKVNIPLRLVPINLATKKPVTGPVERINIRFDKGDLEIPRSVVINRIAEGFISQFNKSIFDDSKYLTHLLHMGDGDNKVITTWTGLKGTSKKDGNCLILKLYEALPTSISTNQKVWITKLQSEPIFDTLTLVGSDVDFCLPLQGPNFKLEVDNGIGYQMYDDLVANGSTTSTSLIQKYVTKTGIDTDKLNIQYASGSVHTFDNFRTLRFSRRTN